MLSQKPSASSGESAGLRLEPHTAAGSNGGTPTTLNSAVAFEQQKHLVPTMLKFFGITQQPFGVTPDPAFLYLSPTHREALASLVYGIESGLGFLTLIAEPGMGKTTLLFALLEKLRHSARSAFLFQTQCTSRELMQFLIAELGYETAGRDFVAMNEELNNHLLREARAGKRFVLVIDEAQNLDPSVLETVRLLSNFETPTSKLLQIILGGQPELATKLASRELVQLRQRLSMLSRLEPLSAEETEQYVMHRLRVGGYLGKSLLTPGALGILVEFAGGVPRKINNFCGNALSLAFALNQREIDSAIAREVVDDLDISRHLPQSPQTTSNEDELDAVPARTYEADLSKLGIKSPERSSYESAHSGEKVGNMTLAESVAYLNRLTRSIKSTRS